MKRVTSTIVSRDAKNAPNFEIHENAGFFLSQNSKTLIFRLRFFPISHLFCLLLSIFGSRSLKHTQMQAIKAEKIKNNEISSQL